MKKTELTKEQQRKFKWLMDADTENEDVYIDKWIGLVWKDGIWEDGIWEDGVWKGGKMWDNLKQKYVRVKWNKEKKIFEENRE